MMEQRTKGERKRDLPSALLPRVSTKEREREKREREREGREYGEGRLRAGMSRDENHRKASFFFL